MNCEGESFYMCDNCSTGCDTIFSMEWSYRHDDTGYVNQTQTFANQT